MVKSNRDRSKIFTLICMLFSAPPAWATDATELISTIKSGPAERDQSPFLQAGRALQEQMKTPSARTPAIKNELLALSKNPNGAIQNVAFDCLMQFKGDPDARRVLIDALHNHPNPMTRGVMTGKLMVNTDHDPSVLPELRKALHDDSEFVRVRAAQDLGRQGDFSGLSVIKAILSETPAPNPHPVIGSVDPDTRVGLVARAAGEIMHPELLPQLKRLAALGKTAPSSSAEARSAMWLTELKMTSDSTERIKMLRAFAKEENALFWFERTLIYKLDQLNISKDDVIDVLKESATSPDFNISHEAKWTITRYETYSPSKQ